MSISIKTCKRHHNSHSHFLNRNLIEWFVFQLELDNYKLLCISISGTHCHELQLPTRLLVIEYKSLRATSTSLILSENKHCNLSQWSCLQVFDDKQKVSLFKQEKQVTAIIWSNEFIYLNIQICQSIIYMKSSSSYPYLNAKKK